MNNSSMEFPKPIAFLDRMKGRQPVRLGEIEPGGQGSRQESIQPEHTGPERKASKQGGKTGGTDWFARIPRYEIDTYMAVVGPTAWAVYTALYRFRNIGGHTCYPATGTIGKMVGIHRSGVTRWIDRLDGTDGVLAKAGLAPLIAVEEREQKSGRFTSNQYRFLDPKPP